MACYVNGVPNLYNIVCQIQPIISIGEKEDEMYKYITCPQCGKRLCRAELGSNVEITCPSCKQDIKASVDKDGGVHTLPLDSTKPQK